MSRSERIAVISDTHGKLRATVLDALADVPLVLHAGDVGKPEVLVELRRVAPLVAIRGNVDRDEWADELPFTTTVEWNGRRIHLVHDRQDIDIDPAAEGIDVVISGHSHKPAHEVIDGVTWFNPGSVGPRRFNLPISMAWLSFPDDGGLPEVEFRTFAP